MSIQQPREEFYEVHMANLLAIYVSKLSWRMKNVPRFSFIHMVLFHSPLPDASQSLFLHSCSIQRCDFDVRL